MWDSKTVDQRSEVNGSEWSFLLYSLDCHLLLPKSGTTVHSFIVTSVSSHMYIYISLLPDLTVRNLRPGIQLSNNKCFKEERKEGGRGGYTVTLSAKEAETQRD